MSHLGMRITARAALLAATFFTAAPAFAQESDLEDRLDRLEALVAGLIERLDAQQSANAQQTAALKAEQQAMREQAQAALQATRSLETRQAEMSA
ncbi:MAG: hypothetical protein AAF672_16875, partial [Pseudomonadota bacterium]